jgi:pimeloyl-ACP methyl ester carboxylesterase
MGAYIEVGGLKTWYDEEGSGEPLVLVHGGLSPNETWAPQMPEFAKHFRVLAPERRGHGHTPDVEGPFSYDDMATDTIGFLEAIVGGPAHLVGWSDGGIIGLIVAMRRPDLVGKLVSISANFDTTGVPEEIQSQFLSMQPDSEGLATLRSMYEAASPDGPEHWPVVFAKFIDMVSREPRIASSELERIAAPTLVVAGDDDLVSLEHTIELFRSIPNAELAIVPGTSHFPAMEKADVVNRLILDFIENDPSPTMMPIRRAARSLTPAE